MALTPKNADVRTLLLPLTEFSQRYKVAVLGITHLSKGDQRNILNNLTGSIAFGAVARTVLIVAKDPENESRRFVIQAKNDLEKDNLHLAYRIEKMANGIGNCQRWPTIP